MLTVIKCFGNIPLVTNWQYVEWLAAKSTYVDTQREYLVSGEYSRAAQPFLCLLWSLRFRCDVGVDVSVDNKEILPGDRAMTCVVIKKRKVSHLIGHSSQAWCGIKNAVPRMA